MNAASKRSTSDGIVFVCSDQSSAQSGGGGGGKTLLARHTNVHRHSHRPGSTRFGCHRNDHHHHNNNNNRDDGDVDVHSCCFADGGALIAAGGLS